MLQVWNLVSGTMEHLLEGHSAWVSVVVVTPDGRQCSAIRRKDTDDLVIDTSGEGPMMRALLRVWDEPGGRAA
jgi:WD40 repeat protein